MDEQRTVHLDLTLHFSAQTVTGQIRTLDGRERAFVGWLGLLAALDPEHPAAAAKGEGDRR